MDALVRGYRPEVILYESPRRFEVCGWGVGHRGLLLRSNRSEHFPSRIEVLFKPAYTVCLASSLANGLTIREAGAESPGPWQAFVHSDQIPGCRLYEVRSGDDVGWGLGGSVNGRQDEGDFDDPTMFTGWEAAPGVTDLFSNYDGR